MKRGKKAIQTSLGRLLTLKPSLSQKDQETQNPFEAADTNLNALNATIDHTKTADITARPEKLSEIVDVAVDTCNLIDNATGASATNVTILALTEERRERAIDSSVLHVRPMGGHFPSVSNSDSSS